MAVENLKSNLYRADGGLDINPNAVAGVVTRAIGLLTNSAGASSTSTYKIASVVASDIVGPGTYFDVENWGFAQIVIGTLSDTDALVDQTLVTSNDISPIVNGDANHGKQWWEALGLAAKPLSNRIDLYAHAEAGATGAGNMPFVIESISNP